MHFFQKCVESSVATQFGKDEVLENFLDKGKLPWFNATIVCPILLYSIHFFVYYIPRQDFLRTDEDLLWTCSQVRFDWKHPWNHLQIWKSCNNIAPRNRWTMNMCWSHINILSPFRRNSVDTPKKPLTLLDLLFQILSALKTVVPCVGRVGYGPLEKCPFLGRCRGGGPFRWTLGPGRPRIHHI